jgi:hypothetical protein
LILPKQLIFECSIFICIHLAVAEYSLSHWHQLKKNSKVKFKKLRFWSSIIQLLNMCLEFFVSNYYVVNSLEVCSSCHFQYILILPCNLSASTNMSIEVLNVEVATLYEVYAIILLTVVMCKNMNICSCFIVFVNTVTLYKINLKLFNYR